MKHIVIVLYALCTSLTFAAQKPNVVYLLADDFGWGDVGAHKGTIPTPNMDKLFRQGVELTQFMGWCVCSPTRAMLQTGRHPFRVGTGPEVGGELAKEETTIAEVFKANGYATGIFGKWHNGEDPDTPEYKQAFKEAWKSVPNKSYVTGFGVQAHGYDEAWVYYGGGSDYFTRRTVGGKGPVSWWHNLEYRPQDAGYTEDLITENALNFIRANKARPFFCYIPFHIVHTPLQAKDSDLADVDAKVTDEDTRRYHAMVMAMDKNIASVLAELEKLGLRDNTVVVFTSDNGATKCGSNAPLRGGKHSIYEGGVRLPTVIHWPAGKLAGRTWNGLCGALDMLPSLAALCELKLPATRPLDGKNIWPALRDNGKSPVESYYWAWRNEDALRTDEWKLHRFADRVELYNIKTDEGEAKDLSKDNPDIVKALAAKMDAWVLSLGAQLAHQPARTAGDKPESLAPKPEGDILEFAVTVTDKSKPRDQLVIHFATPDGRVQATDRLEFDIRFAPDMKPGMAFFSPFQNKEAGRKVLFFGRGVGLDQFGREQDSGPLAQGEKGAWEHRVIGLSSFAPNTAGLSAMIFTGGEPGTRKVWLDNLKIRHADNSVTPIWSGKADSRFRKYPDAAPFADINVRVVTAASDDRTPSLNNTKQ
jgi:arylsulfatase A-like enzyme